MTDDQGESDRDTVSVQIKPDPLEMHLLEMTLNVPVSTFTQSQLDSLVQKMALLLKEDVKVNVTEVRGEIDTGNTQLIFFLSEEVCTNLLVFCEYDGESKRADFINLLLLPISYLLTIRYMATDIITVGQIFTNPLSV